MFVREEQPVSVGCYTAARDPDVSISPSQAGSIQSARWPVPGPVDPVLLKKADYLTNTVHEFRIKYKNYLTPGETW